MDWLRHQWIPVAIFALFALLTAIDIAMDLAAGTTFGHVLVEFTLMLCAATGAIYFWKRLRLSRQHERELERDLRRARVEMAQWQADQRELLGDLREAIDQQFDRWEFSATEKEIAYHLLKGLSMKYIAALKGSTPRSVTQQSYVLYHKAGLGGRAELSAYFLDTLFRHDPGPRPSSDEPGS